MATSKKIFFFGEDHLTAGLALSLVRGTIIGQISEQEKKFVKATKPFYVL